MTRPGTPAPTRAADKPAPARAEDAPSHRRGLTPQRTLFVALLVLMGLWIALLAWMYVDTVYPVRHGHDGAVSPAAPQSQP
jgi:hypothetical protein